MCGPHWILSTALLDPVRTKPASGKAASSQPRPRPAQNGRDARVYLRDRFWQRPHKLSYKSPWMQNAAQDNSRFSPDSGPDVSEAKIPARDKALGPLALPYPQLPATGEPCQTCQGSSCNPNSRSAAADSPAVPLTLQTPTDPPRDGESGYCSQTLPCK